MTKFKVGDKVRVIGKEGGSVNSVGDIGVIKEFDENDVRVYVEGRLNYANWHGLDEIEHADTSPKQTKSERIAALEAEAQRQDERVADLERKVAELERKLTSKPVYDSLKASLTEAIAKASKSPNEQRKAIIEEAKAFVEKYSGIVRNNTTPYTRKAGDTSVKLFVNEKKRAVAAIPHLVHVGTDFPEDKAIAKAHPDDVFNADIGKAIALGRALGLDVTRFEKAIQPTEVVVGMVVAGSDKDKHAYYSVNSRFAITRQSGSDYYYEGGDGDWLMQYDIGRITDDTEAQY